MKSKATIEQMCEELEEAAALEGSECGEWWSSLCQLQHGIINGASEEFRAAWEKELRAEHARFKKDFQFVEEEVTHTYKERRLEYIG